MDLQTILTELRSKSDPKNVAGMGRFGISTHKTLGVSMPRIRALAKKIGKNHELAMQLWDSEIHEARILASLIAESDKFTESDMEAWVKDFDSWDVCDQVCGNVFDKTPIAYRKAIEWSSREPEFEKRAGFALMAWLAVHDKKANNKKFEDFLPYILQQADDPRNFVKKSVNWALRHIGKRHNTLRSESLILARKILKTYPRSSSAQWIAHNAIQELENPKTIERVMKKSS